MEQKKKNLLFGIVILKTIVTNLFGAITTILILDIWILRIVLAFPRASLADC